MIVRKSLAGTNSPTAQRYSDTSFVDRNDGYRQARDRIDDGLLRTRHRIGGKARAVLLHRHPAGLRGAILHAPLGIEAFFDYNEGMAYAKKIGKPFDFEKAFASACAWIPLKNQQIPENLRQSMEEIWKADTSFRN